MNIEREPPMTRTDRRAATFTLRNHPEFGTVTFTVWPADDTAVVSADAGDQAMSIESAREMYRTLRAECRAAA
jgi:hypothetical protein